MTRWSIPISLVACRDTAGLEEVRDLAALAAETGGAIVRADAGTGAVASSDRGYRATT